MTPTPQPKPWWRSRTIWFQIVTFSIAVAEAVVDVVPPEWQGYLLASVAILNVILRLDTTGPVGAGKQ